MHAILRSALVATAIVFTIPAAAQSADTSPFNGTWKLDSAASKFTSARVIGSETRTYEVSGDKVKMTSTGTDVSGKQMSVSYTAAYDGKYYPMTGNPVGDNIALKRIDGRTVEATVRKGKKVTGHGKTTVSADGESLVLTRSLLREKGKSAVDELHFVKQR